MILTATMTKDEMNKVCSLIGELDKDKGTRTKEILTGNNVYNFGNICITVHGNSIKINLDKKDIMGLSFDTAMKLFMFNTSAFIKRFIDKNTKLISESEEAIDDYDEDDDIEPCEVDSYMCNGMLVYNV